MGKVRGKSTGSGVTNNNHKGGKPTPSTSSSSALNLSSGRISKSSKKSVTFRSNLTDVASSTNDVHNNNMRTDVIPGRGMMSNHASTSSSSMMALCPSDVNNDGGMVNSPINLTRLGKTLKKEVKEKKSRMKIRREAFHKKIELIKMAEAEEKEEKKRKATPIVGDTKPLRDALPETSTATAAPASTSGGVVNPLMDLAGFVASHNLEEFKSIPKRKKFNTKQRQKEIEEGLAYFQQALNCQPPIL